MKIVIASDHGGFQYKNLLLNDISKQGYELTDLGAFNEAPSDYPDYAEAVANAGYKLSAKKAWWLDIGVLPSHIGFESAVGKDNWTLTRRRSPRC